MTQNKRLIAVTGGIGSGKSTACEFFAPYGEILSCDKINAEMLTEPEYLSVLQTSFPEVFDENGTFNKRKLSEIIFSDEGKRKKLNEIAHPEIMKRLLHKITNSSRNIFFIEVPLLFGTNFERMFSEIIVITAPENMRETRIMARDEIQEEGARNKISSQKNAMKQSQDSTIYTVPNDGDINKLKSNCELLIKKILK